MHCIATLIFFPRKKQYIYFKNFCTTKDIGQLITITKASRWTICHFYNSIAFFHISFSIRKSDGKVQKLGRNGDYH